MSSWLQRQAESQQIQLISVAVVSGLTVAGTILGVQALRHRIALDELKAAIPNVDEKHETETVPDFTGADTNALGNKEDERASALALRARAGHYDEELIEEQLTRTSSFLTPAGLSKLRAAFVIVVGLGGVGSHCTAALARSGVSRIRLIDFDQVTLSSLNRHAVATLADVGTPKVQCVRKRVEAAVPWVKWHTCNEIWKESEAERLLGEFDQSSGKRPDYVVDAIDNIDSKVALLKYCHTHNIKVISSMGAGCKSDPTRIQVGDISQSAEDPLSRATRRRLKLLGITQGLPVVYSTEKTGPGKATLLPLSEEESQKGLVGELSVLPDFRVRILPVLGTMPASFGYVVANYIMMELTSYPHESTMGKGRDKLYDSILGTLQGSEEKLARSEGFDALGLKIPLTKDDVGYLVDEVFRGKSVVSGLCTRLTLVRWRALEAGYAPNTDVDGQKSSRLEMRDLVCMTREEASRHEDKILLGKQQQQQAEDLYSPSVLELVQRRLRDEAAYDMYR